MKKFKRHCCVFSLLVITMCYNCCFTQQTVKAKDYGRQLITSINENSKQQDYNTNYDQDGDGNIIITPPTSQPDNGSYNEIIIIAMFCFIIGRKRSKRKRKKKADKAQTVAKNRKD